MSYLMCRTRLIIATSLCLAIAGALASAAPKHGAGGGARPASPAPGAAPAKPGDAEPFPREWFLGSDKLHKAQLEMNGTPMTAIAAQGWYPAHTGLADLQTKIGVVMLWTTYDDNCLQALRTLEAMKSHLSDKPVGIVAISTLYGNEEGPKIAEQNNISFGVAHDEDGATFKAWGAQVWPTIGVMDKEGNIRAMGVKPQYVEAVVVTLLKNAGDLPANYPVPLPTATTEPTTNPATGPADKPGDAGVAKSDGKNSDTPSEKSGKPKSDDGPVVNGIARKWLRGTDEQRKRFASLDNHIAMGIHGDNFVNSPTVGLDDFNQKVVLLHFWNAANGASIAAITRTRDLASKYADQGLVVIALCSPKGAANMEKIIAARGLKFPCALDTDDTSAKRYRVEGSGDSFFIINRPGILRVCDCEKEHLEDAIKAVLAEKQPEYVPPMKPGGRGGG